MQTNQKIAESSLFFLLAQPAQISGMPELKLQCAFSVSYLALGFPPSLQLSIHFCYDITVDISLYNDDNIPLTYKVRRIGRELVPLHR